MQPSVWIVVANQSKAKFYQYEGERASPRFLFEMDHPEGRDRVGQLVSDRAGRTTAGISPLRHALDRANDAHSHEANAFARQVALKIKEARRRERFSGLALVCEPKFLGRLRESLDRESRKAVLAERAAGVVQLTENELAESIRGLIEPSSLIRVG